MNAPTLRARLDAPDAPLLVNVLPPEAFAARQIAGSCNACVYEVSFLDQMDALAPRDRAVVLHGAGGGSHDAATAAAKLAAAGWTDVTVFADGLAGWAAAGLPLAGEAPPAPVLDGTYVLDRAASLVRWTGRSPFNQHRGTVGLGEGAVVFAAGTLVSARIAIDMGAIACDDLAGGAYHDVLIKHLHNEDFFDVANHPEAVFEAGALTPCQPARDGHPCYAHDLDGRFTLRGVTQPLQVPITLGSADGLTVTGQAVVALDRTAYGSLYGSSRLFAYLGGHVVDDLIHLDLKLVARRA